MESRETIPILKEVLVELTLEQHPWTTQAFGMKIQISSSWDWTDFMPMMHPWI
jgi:hypothetical protein